MNDFYIYALFRPWNLQPCYIGKGRGDRFEYHAKQGVNHYNKHLSSIFKKANGADLPCVILHFGLDERTAFTYEKALIAAIGRADLGLGPLCNHTDGGEGISGFRHSEEFKSMMRDRTLGIPKSDKTRAKMRLAQSGKKPSEKTIKAAILANTGNTYCLGYKHTAEMREKTSAASSARRHSEESKAKTSAALKGVPKNPKSIKKMMETKRLKKEALKINSTSLGLRDSPSSKQTVIVA